MRAAVGQVLTVVLRNNLPWAVNLEPAGVQPVDVAAGGGVQTPLAPPVAPGETRTYRFRVPAELGPSPSEPSAKLWLYRSTTDLVADGNAGLVGPLLIRCGSCAGH